MVNPYTTRWDRTPDYTCAVVALLRDADTINRIIWDSHGDKNPRKEWTIEKLEEHLAFEHYPMA